jgi:hypothetical protein
MYLGALIVNAVLMVQLGYALLLAAIGPAWVLRRGSPRPLWTAPLAVIALAVFVPLILGSLGANCPIEGMDHLDQCNARATAAMLFLYGGVLVLQVSAAAAVYAMLVRGGRAVLHR